MSELVLKHVAAGHGGEGRTLEVGGQWDGDDELFLVVVDGDDFGPFGWVSRKQVRKMRDHLSAMLEQPKRGWSE